MSNAKGTGRKFQYEGGYVEYHKTHREQPVKQAGRPKIGAYREIANFTGFYCMSCKVRSEHMPHLLLQKGNFFCPKCKSGLLRIRPARRDE
jgi:hypothetical protein